MRLNRLTKLGAAAAAVALALGGCTAEQRAEDGTPSASLSIGSPLA